MPAQTPVPRNAIMRQIASFIVRVWRAGSSQRITVEHIQSGAKGLMTTAAEASDWIDTRVEQANNVPMMTSVQTDLPSDHARSGDSDEMPADGTMQPRADEQ